MLSIIYTIAHTCRYWLPIDHHLHIVKRNCSVAIACAVKSSCENHTLLTPGRPKVGKNPRCESITEMIVWRHYDIDNAINIAIIIIMSSV